MSNMDYDYNYDQQSNIFPKQAQSLKNSLGQSSSAASSSSIVSTKLIGLVLGLSVIGVVATTATLAGVFYWTGSQNARNITTTSTESTTTLSLSAIDLAIDSTVLTSTEKSNLWTLSGFRTYNLLYRATRDGFSAHIFHRLCDNKVSTLTIYRNSLNSVYGGYTQALWNSIGGYRTDSTAFLFSLRRRGVSNNEKFTSTNSFNIYAAASYFPTFGNGHDIYVCDNPDINTCSYSSFCTSYTCPTSFVTANQYLAGLHTNYLITEIEIYQVS